MHFLFEQQVPADRSRVFAFFADPANLEVLHREDRAFRLLHCSGSVSPGSMTWVECRMAGVLPVVLGFRHDGWEPGHWFSEQLVHGPFTRFVHRHEFASTPGGTLVRDLLDLRLPATFGGEPATRMLVAPGVQRRFRLRREALARIFAAPGRGAS